MQASAWFDYGLRRSSAEAKDKEWRKGAKKTILFPASNDAMGSNARYFNWEFDSYQAMQT